MSQMAVSTAKCLHGALLGRKSPQPSNMCMLWICTQHHAVQLSSLNVASAREQCEEQLDLQDDCAQDR